MRATCRRERIVGVCGFGDEVEPSLEARPAPRQKRNERRRNGPEPRQQIEQQEAAHRRGLEDLSVPREPIERPAGPRACAMSQRPSCRRQGIRDLLRAGMEEFRNLEKSGPSSTCTSSAHPRKTARPDLEVPPRGSCPRRAMPSARLTRRFPPATGSRRRRAGDRSPAKRVRRGDEVLGVIDVLIVVEPLDAGEDHRPRLSRKVTLRIAQQVAKARFGVSCLPSAPAAPARHRRVAGPALPQSRRRMRRGSN